MILPFEFLSSYWLILFESSEFTGLLDEVPANTAKNFRSLFHMQAKTYFLAALLLSTAIKSLCNNGVDPQIARELFTTAHAVPY